MAGRPELAGDGHDRATGLSFQIRRHRAKEGAEASPNKTPARPGGIRVARSMADGHGVRRSTRLAQMSASICEEIGRGRSGGREELTHAKNGIEGARLACRRSEKRGGGR